MRLFEPLWGIYRDPLQNNMRRRKRIEDSRCPPGTAISAALQSGTPRIASQRCVWPSGFSALKSKTQSRPAVPVVFHMRACGWPSTRGCLVEMFQAQANRSFGSWAFKMISHLSDLCCPLTLFPPLFLLFILFLTLGIGHIAARNAQRNRSRFRYWPFGPPEHCLCLRSVL